MSDPLNPEQTQEIENIRRFVTENPHLKDWAHYQYKALLLSIFDALQSKKQYTEEELRHAMMDSGYSFSSNTFDGVRWCAQFLGVLKQEKK